MIGRGQFNKFLTLKDYIYQIVFGSIYHPIFWFQFNLILIIICIFCYFMQYSGKNYYFFLKYNRLKMNIGEIVEMIPFAINGIICSENNIIDKCIRFREKTLIICIFIIYIIFYNELFIKPKGFLYPGIMLNFGAFLLFCFFGTFPFELIKTKKIIFIIKLSTSFTGGIYYLHMVIFRYLKNQIKYIIKRSYKGCIFIYFLCYFICFIGNKLTIKSKLKSLFN